MTNDLPDSARPPVAFGCIVMATLLVVVIGIAAFAVAFLESGAESGLVRLEEAAAYPPGTVEFVGAQNLYLIRLLDESFVALADLDAANRAATGRRCRVALVPLGDPSLAAVLQEFGPRMSPDAAGGRAVFREDCNGALYDVAGYRLDDEGRNLDRYPVVVASDGHVEIDVTTRQCSLRRGAAYFASVTC